MKRLMLLGLVLIGIVFISGCVQQPKIDNAARSSSNYTKFMSFADITHFISTYKFNNISPISLSENLFTNEKFQKQIADKKVRDFEILVWLNNSGLPQAEAIVFETSDESYTLLAERFFLKTVFVVEICGGSIGRGSSTKYEENCEEVGEIPHMIGTKTIGDEEIKIYYGNARGIGAEDGVVYIWNNKKNLGLIAVTNSSFVNELDKMFETIFTSRISE